MTKLDFEKETFGFSVKGESVFIDGSVYMYRDIGSRMLFKNTLVNLCNLVIKVKMA